MPEEVEVQRLRHEENGAKVVVIREDELQDDVDKRHACAVFSGNGDGLLEALCYVNVHLCGNLLPRGIRVRTSDAKNAAARAERLKCIWDEHNHKLPLAQEPSQEIATGLPPS